jgi:hypothetical protein
MKQIAILTITVIVVILLATLLVSYSLIGGNNEIETFYVGVSFCGNTVEEARILIDRVKEYTNLFVLQSGPISNNETAINEICDYATAAKLDIIVYFGWFDPNYPWRIPWLDMAKQRWGNHFLGVYYYDEPGGIQLDYNWARLFGRIKEQNMTLYQTLAPGIDGDAESMEQLYDLSAKMYLAAIETDPGIKELKSRSITAFTSDYALYWWGYLGGYDVLLAQFGWNHTIKQDIALIRGAARLQNKPWGAIITWKYDEPPYIDSGDQIYAQMHMAYEAGAKYVVIFNYPQIEGCEYGILKDEHFDALEKFWNDITESNSSVWASLVQYGTSLDIVFEDSAFPVAGKYPRIYYWNNPI